MEDQTPSYKDRTNQALFNGIATSCTFSSGGQFWEYNRTSFIRLSFIRTLDYPE